VLTTLSLPLPLHTRSVHDATMPRCHDVQEARYALYLRPSLPPAHCADLVRVVSGGTNKKWGGAHVTLCSFGSASAKDTETHKSNLLTVAKEVSSVAQQVHPERSGWQPSPKLLKWYMTDPSGWVIVTLGASTTLKAICQVICRVFPPCPSPHTRDPPHPRLNRASNWGGRRHV
jgi:hypothetical protein